MALNRSKRAVHTSSLMKNEMMTKKMNNIIEDETTAMMIGLQFPILELPMHLIYDIISRLPLKTIFSCKCVCRTFLKILSDPYFAKIHLTKAHSTAATLIVQERWDSVVFRPYMLDIDDTWSTSSCSTDHHPYHRHYLSGPHHGLTPPPINAKCGLLKGNVTLIGSCNGLLCLYRPSGEPLYCICNPLSGECMALPPLTSSTSDFTYLNHSGFGFCPKTNQYKVIRFMCLTSFDPFMILTSRTVAVVHTLGTKSWRNIGDAPCPKTRGSFDPFLCGALHWITDSHITSNLIFSFDLETEEFRPVPLPAHFGPDYVRKISWISVGVLGGCLCVCNTLDVTHFEVWVMKDYGVKESWIKEFVIDIEFYCGLQVEDLQQPIKFLNNGDLWLICKSNSLVSYSSQKGTFRDIKKLGYWEVDAIAHVPSFVSLENAVLGENLEIEKIKLESVLLN